MRIQCIAESRKWSSIYISPSAADEPFNLFDLVHPLTGSRFAARLEPQSDGVAFYGPPFAFRAVIHAFKDVVCVNELDDDIGHARARMQHLVNITNRKGV